MKTTEYKCFNFLNGKVEVETAKQLTHEQMVMELQRQDSDKLPHFNNKRGKVEATCVLI